MIEEFIAGSLASIFGLAVDSRLVESLSFFIYDSIKILLLVFVMIAAVGYLRSYYSEKKIKEKLSKKGLIGNLFASIFGAVTPFCSCSSIPFFMSSIRAGVPLGVTFSFLITSPLVNEYVAVIMFATFGWKITLAYIIAGILIGVIAGAIIGKMNMEKYIEKEFAPENNKNVKEVVYKNQKERLLFGLKEAKKITKEVWIWVIVGVGIGALIHGFVPDELIHSFVSKGGYFAVPLAVVLGVPLYANCAAIIPIALVLFEKGFPLGTALAFMMATAALSFPEFVILRKVIKLKLILIFFVTVAVSIVVVGYLFNFLQVVL